MIQSKRCSKCRQEKPVEAFHKDKSQRDGYRSQCRVCRAESREMRGGGRAGVSIRPSPKLSAQQVQTLQMSDKEVRSLAKQTALKQLVENHAREFRVLVIREYERLGVPQKWRSLS